MFQFLLVAQSLNITTLLAEFSASPNIQSNLEYPYEIRNQHIVQTVSKLTALRPCVNQISQFNSNTFHNETTFCFECIGWLLAD